MIMLASSYDIFSKYFGAHAKLHVLFFLCLNSVIAFGEETEFLTFKSKHDLIQKAEYCQLPKPKPESKLVKVYMLDSGYSMEEMTNNYFLGFIEPENPNQLLIGFNYYDIADEIKTVEILKPFNLKLNEISTTTLASYIGAPINHELLLGVQLIHFGLVEFGEALVNKSINKSYGHHLSNFFISAGESPLIMLAKSCIASEFNKIKSNSANFTEIKQNIERLIKDEPKLKNKTIDFVLESLKENILYEKNNQNSIEKIIDNYLFDNREHGLFSFDNDFSLAEKALILEGFKIVPALIKQKNSKRFTNHIMIGFNNFPTYIMTADQVINIYLQRFSNNQFESNWLERQKNILPKDQIIKRWWHEAYNLGEKEYVKRYTIITDKENKASLSAVLLFLAEKRYPELIPEIYLTVLKTSIYSHLVAQALMNINEIDREQKIRLFEVAIDTDHEAHRNSALRYLQDIESQLGDKHIIDILKSAPNTPIDKYWTDKNAYLGNHVSRSVNVDVWDELNNYLNRADLGMRMELIKHLTPSYDAPVEVLQSFYGIYKRYYDDTTIRDVSLSEKFSGPVAGFLHERIEVRNIIHLHWAEWLELKIDIPGREGTHFDWKMFRRTVNKAVREYFGELNIH